jgi:cyclohexadienyl dehydratase
MDGMMRRSLLAAMIVTGLGAMPAMAEPAKSLLFQIQERGTLRVGMTGDYRPMTFRDPATGNFEGHQVDAAKELANDLGVEVELVPTDWKTIIAGLQAGKYDIAMSGTSMSLARAKVVGLVDSWGMNAFVPIVRKADAGKYQSWQDLDQPERTVGVNLGTTMEDFIKAELPKAEMKRVEAPATGWQEVLAGRVDYAMATLIEGAALEQTYPDLKLIFTDQPKNQLPMTFLVPIDDTIWLNYMNEWVFMKKSVGYFAQLNEKWGVTLP